MGDELLEIRLQIDPVGEGNTIGIRENLRASFDDGKWTVVIDDVTSYQWRGEGETKKAAILNYLADRLAVPNKELTPAQAEMLLGSMIRSMEMSQYPDPDDKDREIAEKLKAVMGQERFGGVSAGYFD